jgi:hypothetical protein
MSQTVSFQAISAAMANAVKNGMKRPKGRSLGDILLIHSKFLK